MSILSKIIEKTVKLKRNIHKCDLLVELKVVESVIFELLKKEAKAELFHQMSNKDGKNYLDLSYLDKESDELKPFSPIIYLDKEQVAFDA